MDCVNVHNKRENPFIEALFCLYAAECAFGCSGRLLAVGGFSLRMLLFSLCFAASIPLVLQKMKTFVRKPAIILTIAFFGVLLISAFIGIRNGNPRRFLVSDLTSFLALALFPGMYAAIDTKDKLERLINAIFIGTLIIAFVTIAVHFYTAFAPIESLEILNRWINERELGGLGLLKTGIMRVFFRSQVFLQFSFMLGLGKIWNSNGRRRILLYICEGAILFAMILSYTRGFWLGAACSVLLLILMYYHHIRQIILTLCGCLTILLLLLAVSWIYYGGPYVGVETINRIEPDKIIISEFRDYEGSLFNGENGIDALNEESASIRRMTVNELQRRIRISPLFGSGLGANLDGVRNYGKAEYMYLDMLMKLGWFGFAVFLLCYFFLPVQYVFRKRIKDSRAWQETNLNSSSCRLDLLLAGYLSVGITNVFNPYLNNPMGILILMIVCLSVEVSELERDNAFPDALDINNFSKEKKT